MFKIVTKLCLFFIIGFLTYHTVSAQNWVKVEGTEKSVTFITLDKTDKTKVIVGSDQSRTDFAGIGQVSFPQIGFGYEVSSDSAQTFSEAQLAGWNIYDIYISKIDPLKWFAAIRTFGLGSIIISTDGGSSWNEDTKLCQSTAQTVKIASVTDGTKESYYAAATNTNQGFRSTENEFTDCLISDSISVQARDFKISPLNSNMMFIVGDNFGINHGQFMRSTDKGNSWQSISLGNANYRALSVMPSPTDPAVVFIGLDSITATEKLAGIGIWKSIDTGSTWTPVAGTQNSRIFDIRYHPSHPAWMAAAADSAGVWISNNGGIYWEQKKSGFPDDVSVRNVAIPDWEFKSGGMVVLAGTLNSGFYKSEPLIVGVEDQKIAENSSTIYPNPASDKIKVKLNGNSAGNLRISLFDMTGNEIGDLYNGRSENYSAQEMDIRGYSTGAYMIVINLNGLVQAHTLTINR